MITAIDSHLHAANESSPGADFLWLAVLALAGLGRSLVLACIAPFVALAVALAGTVRLVAALRAMTITWLANQFVDIEGLSPRESDFDADGALTREFLLRRGTCCENGCRNCPYGFDARGRSQPPIAQSDVEARVQ